jgi:hypothetical protein
MRSRKSQRGSTLVEMAFVGIPMIFLIISLFEISRGMWIYTTLSYAARESTRYISMHGQNCQLQNCGVTPAQLGTYIENVAAGLDPTKVTVTFTSLSDYFVCPLNTLQNGTCVTPGGGGTGGFGFVGWWDWLAQFQCTVLGENCGNVTSTAQCASATYIPTCGGNGVGAPITIQLTFPFNSSIAMFFPGSKPQQFGQAVLPAQSQDVMQY